MKFTKEALEAIDNKKFDLLGNYRKRHGVGVALHDGRVCVNSLSVCNVDELTKLIEDLTDLREAIKVVTGIEF